MKKIAFVVVLAAVASMSPASFAQEQPTRHFEVKVFKKDGVTARTDGKFTIEIISSTNDRLIKAASFDGAEFKIEYNIDQIPRNDRRIKVIVTDAVDSVLRSELLNLSGLANYDNIQVIVPESRDTKELCCYCYTTSPRCRFHLLRRR